MNEFLPVLFADRLWILAGMIGLAVALTIVVFYRHLFDEGFEKGDAADPDQVRRENPPDEWVRSHWIQ
jgi:hypothetical protein